MLTNRRRPRASRAHGPALVLGAALVLSGCASGPSAGFPPEPASATVPASDPSAESVPSSTAQTSEGSEVPPPETDDTEAGDTEAGAGSSGSAASPSAPNTTAVPVNPAAPGAVEKAPEPVRVLYPELDADLPVEPRGVSDDGQMDVPEDAAQAGWYQYGKAPADEVGNTVITAHAGSAQTPIGPLYELTEANQGDEVTVVDESGEEHRYRVTETQQLGKDGLDFTPYFERTGEHQLVLITCGGQWLPEKNSYAENVIVVAEPID